MSTTIQELDKALAKARAEYDIGRFHSALELLEPWADGDAAPWEIYQLAGTAASSEKQFGEALGYYAKALNSAGDDVQASYTWAASARVHAARGSLTRSRKALENALRLNPSLGPAWVDLAAVKLETHDYTEAANLLDKSYGLGFRSARQHSVAAELALAQNRFEDALKLYQRAYEMDRNSAGALYGVAVVLAIFGRIEEARETLEALHQLDANYPAYWLRAQLTAFDADQKSLTLLENRLQLLDSDGQDIDQRVDLIFALAKANEDIGRYNEAFELYKEANALKKSTVSPEALKIEAAPDRGFDRLLDITKTLEVIDEDSFSESPSTPVFIVGMPRSGSTLLEQMLASNINAASIGESGFMGTLMEGLIRHTEVHGLPESAGELAGLVNGIRYSYFQSAETITPITDVDYFVDKSLANFRYIGLIKAIFPESHVIHIQRGPLDNCVGCFRKLFAQGLTFTYDYDDLISYYTAYRQRISEWAAYKPDLFDTIFYENLALNPEQELTALPAALKPLAHGDMKQFYKSGNPVNTASLGQIRKPLNSSGILRWKRFEGYIGPLIEGLASHEEAYQESLKQRMGETGTL